MKNIAKEFEGTRVYNDVTELLEKGKATFCMVDLNWGLYDKLISLLKINGFQVTEKNNWYSIYCRDFTLNNL